MWRTSTKTLYCWRPKPYLCHPFHHLSWYCDRWKVYFLHRHHHLINITIITIVRWMDGWKWPSVLLKWPLTVCCSIFPAHDHYSDKSYVAFWILFSCIFYYAWDKYWWLRWKILRMKVKNIDDEGKKYWWWWWQILMMIVTNIDDDGEKYWHASVCQTVCAATKQARPQFGVMRPNELWHQGTNLCRPFLEAVYWKNLIKDSFWAKMSRVISVRYPL